MARCNLRVRFTIVRFTMLAAAVLTIMVVVVSAATRPAAAVDTRTFVLDSSADLSAGVLDRVAVTSDGQVTVGVNLQRIALEPGAANVWAILDMGNQGALVGTGIDGRVYRVEGTRATLYAETGAVVVTSLARGEDGTVYAGTIPDGKVFRLRPPLNGHPQTPELFVRLPDVEHIWAMTWDRGRHALIVATGPQGKLFAIDHGARASVIFDSDEPHLYSLALGPDGTLYTGAGGGHAVLYSVRGPGQVRALGRFAGDEVKGIVVVGNEVYAAANEFSEPPEAPRRTLGPSRTPSPGGPSAPRPRPGHGSVYRVRPDVAAERIYYNPEAHVTALEVDREHGNEVLAALGVNGRVVAIAQDRTSRIVIDVDENQVLSLAITGHTRLLGTGDVGTLYLATDTQPSGATWTSRVLDASAVSRWGALRWRGTGQLDWQARSGNSDPPDSTWSPWTGLLPDGVVSAPSGRYVQVRAKWDRDPHGIVRAVTVYYLPANQRPVLTEVTAEPKTGDPRPQAVHIGWKVDNPDNDTLRYRLWFRGDAEQNWRSVLRQGEFVTVTTYDWPVEGLPEGFYRVQVEASDEAANPEGESQRDTRSSEPVLVDNTPPRVTAQIAAGHVLGEVSDGASAVTRIEIAVDTQEWRPVRAKDGVLDERDELYDTVLPALSNGGEHIVAVRAHDEAGNVGMARVTYRTAAVVNGRR